MHIPDGYLGRQTCVATTAAMVPLWWAAVRRLQATLRLREVPLLALGAGFSFVIMMFNVPIPGGTSGHAVGAVLVAILLGPAAAMVAVSLALVVQALVFADGGLTCLGANCLNMAVLMPWVGWGVYRVALGRAEPSLARQQGAAALGGWAGLSAAAVAAGVEFGLQPLLCVDAVGRPLYCPFGLSVAVPAMAVPHLLVFGLVEALATALVLGHLHRTAPELLARSESAVASRAVPRLALGLGVLVLLTPLGLLVPRWAHAGPAWGEWSSAELRERVGQVPAGVAAAEQAQRALLPDYNLPGGEDAPLWRQLLAYVGSAALGVLLLAGGVLWWRRWLARRDAPRVRRSLARQALATFGRTLAQLLDNETLAAAPGLLQRLEPRAKLLGLLALLVSTLLLSRPVALVVSLALSLSLAAASRVPLGRILGVGLGLAAFSAALVAPAVLNAVTPGHELLVLARLPFARLGPWTLPPRLAVTDAGLLVALRFVLRALACVGWGLLLSCTTRADRLFRALRALGVPSLCVMLLSMMERYLSLSLRSAEELQLARLSRRLGPESLDFAQQGLAAAVVALFRRTQSLSEDVYLAMLSRGWRGEVRLLDESRPRWAEAVFLVAAVVAAVGLQVMG